jgi:hypothetical protein
VQPLPEPTVRGPSPEAGQGEIVVVPDDKGHVTQVASSGPLRISDTHPDSGARRYLLTAGDHRSRGEGAADLERLELSLYGLDGATLLRKLEAARGRVMLEFTDGEPRLSESVPGTFEEVTVSIQSGSQFAPLVLEVPESSQRACCARSAMCSSPVAACAPRAAGSTPRARAVSCASSARPR